MTLQLTKNVGGRLCDESYSTIELLLVDTYLSHPISDFNNFKNSLQNYFFVLTILQDALEAFHNEDYAKFDAIIGNNSCYAVAYIVFWIAQKKKNERFKQLFDSSLDLIYNVKNKVLYEMNNLHMERGLSTDFRQFLEDKKLIFELEIDFIYLGIVFACSISKSRNDNEFDEINYSSLINFYQKKILFCIKKKSAIKLIKNWQKTVSHFNIYILQNHAQYLSDAEKLWANYIFDPYVLVDERKRLCVPSFYAMRVIYDNLVSIPNAFLGLQVNLIEKPAKFITSFTIYYEVHEDKSLALRDPDKMIKNAPIFMFVGCRYVDSEVGVRNNLEMIKEGFFKRDLKELIFAHEVTYPQYPKSLETQNIIPHELELKNEYFRLNELKGFSLEDPSDLCLVHIFINDIQSQMLSAYEEPSYLPKLGKK